MAATSTTNLLGAVNHVLHDIGERQVTAIASPISRQVQAAVQESVSEIATLDDWEWARSLTTATSWVNETATITNALRVHGVSYGDTTNGFRDLSFLDWRVFDSKPLQTFSTTLDNSGRKYFTITSPGQVKVSPYPTDLTTQNKFRFYITTDLVPPALATSFFPIPERAMLLVYKRASYLMAIRHLGDPALAAQYNSEFEAHVQRMRGRERNAPTAHTNMYRRGRGNW